MRFFQVRNSIGFVFVSIICFRNSGVGASTWQRNKKASSRIQENQNSSFHVRFQTDDDKANTTTLVRPSTDSYYYEQSRNRTRKSPRIKNRPDQSIQNNQKSIEQSEPDDDSSCEGRHKLLRVLFCGEGRHSETNDRNNTSPESKRVVKGSKSKVMKKAKPGRRPKGKGNSDSKQRPKETKGPSHSIQPSWIATDSPSVLPNNSTAPSSPPSASIPPILPTLSPTVMGNETFPPTISSTDQNSTSWGPSPMPSDSTPNITGTPSGSPTSLSPTIRMETQPPVESSAPTAMRSETPKPTTSNSSSMQPSIYISAQPTMRIPTMVPSSSPGNSLNRRSTPFSVGYVLKSGSRITGTDFEFAQEVTLQFLNDFLFQQFSASDVTVLETYTGRVQGINETVFDQPEATYGIELNFTNTSVYVPSQQEIDVLIEISFSDPFLTNFQNKLDNLPSRNPFSDTQSIVYTLRNGLDVEWSSSNGVIVQSTYQLPLSGKKLWTTISPIPTVEGSMNVSLQFTPFSLSFLTTSDTIPSTSNSQHAVNITLDYLDDRFRASFESVEEGVYLSLSSTGAAAKSDPRRISFRGEVKMRQTPSLSVTKEKIDLMMELSFSAPHVRPLLSSLQSLPDDNPYSTTTSIQFMNASSYIPVIESTAPNNSSRMSGVSIAAVIVGSLVAVALLVLLIGVGRKHSSRYTRDRSTFSEDEALVEIISESRSASTMRSIMTGGGMVGRWEEKGIFMEENPKDEEEEHSIEFYYDRQEENEQSQDPLFQQPFLRNYGDDVVSAWRR